MSHISRDKDRILARVRRLKGQLEAVERAVEAERDCAEILHLLASVKGASAGLTSELIEEHLRNHVAEVDDPERRSEGADQLAKILRSYLN